MDNLSPEELQAHLNALKMMSSSPGIEQMSQDSTDMSSVPIQDGNEIDKNNKNIEKSPEQPVNDDKEPGIIDQSKKFAQSYENTPYFKKLFPQGPPALDPTGGVGVMGEVKAAAPLVKDVAEEGLNLNRIRELLGRGGSDARMFGDNAKTAAARQAADDASNLSRVNLANADDVQRSTEQMNRQIALQERNEAQKAARRLKK